MDGEPTSGGPEQAGGLEQVGALVAARATARTATDGAGTSTIVGVAGGVAAGKSRFASDLADVLASAHGLDAVVVPSDGFLLPNRELGRRGLTDRKGFPESYDLEAIDAFLADVRAGREVLEVPVYDHLLYDVIAERRRVGRAAVVLFEGINVLRFAERLDLALYLHADEDDLRRWFVGRVLQLRTEAAGVPAAYLAPVAHWDDDTVAAFAAGVWDAVNGPNLADHIAPTRAVADVVVVKGPDHSVVDVVVRPGPA
jgi:type I pantothenate kinase